MLTHDRFEELCALAPLGELSPEEFVELQAHLDECPSCRGTHEDFGRILQGSLPRAETLPKPWTRLTDIWRRRHMDSRAQFLERARAEGLQFSKEAERRSARADQLEVSVRRFAYALGVVAVAASLTAGVFGYRWWMSHNENKAQTAEAVELRSELSELSETNQTLETRLEEVSTARATVEALLTKEQVSGAAVAERARALETQIATLRAEAEELRTAAKGEAIRANGLEARLGAQERRLSEVAREVEGFQAARAGNLATITTQQTRMGRLSEELKTQGVSLARERRLLAADRDIRSLMGARNLHIIDVFDTDSRGKTQRSFGRVFYTEGKSLVFYAFDLADDVTATEAKYSFQAWGHREGASGSTRSLGLFYVDDKAQKRWVLRFDDPEVIRQINSVFVTVEPFGGRKRPSGQKLLYAFLANNPNHP